MKLGRDVDLSRLTTIRIGGKAKLFAEPETPEELRELILFSRDRDIPLYILGGGSNTILGDINGLVVSMRKLSGLSVSESNSRFVLNVFAGTPLREVIALSVRENLRDVYKLVGFPATVGGAVAMNAGSFGVEFSQFLKRVSFVSWSGELQEVSVEELSFSYRASPFPSEGVVVSCLLELERSEEPVGDEFTRIRKLRKESQPIDKPTSGSTFKNPYPEYAGALLERVGMKSYRAGGVSFSEKHANFLVNHGEGKFTDVLTLLSEAKRRVYEEFGIELEEEVRLVEDSGADGWKVL
ncbi:UDP-N-acetylmuramate dehydrogenase [Hydrogenivirga sp.]